VKRGLYIGWVRRWGAGNPWRVWCYGPDAVAVWYDLMKHYGPECRASTLVLPNGECPFF
jgi:hypothetical protein